MMSETVAEFLREKQAQGRSPATIRMYRVCLELFQTVMGDMPISEVSKTVFLDFLIDLQRPDRIAHQSNPNRPPAKHALSRESVRTYYRHIRAFFSWAFEEGYYQSNWVQRVKIPAGEERAPKDLSDADFLRLLETAGRTGKYPERDTAIILLLGDGGIRAGGLLGLTLDNMDLDNGLISVIEKGNKERFVPISEITVAAIREWLAVRDASAGVRAVFISHKTGKALTYSGLRLLLQRLGKRAGVEGRCNPHSFRHFAGRRWMENGGDISALSRFLGHSGIGVTGSYYIRYDTAALKREHAEHSALRGLVTSAR